MSWGAGNTSNFPGDPTVAGMPSTLSAFDSPNFGFSNSASLPQLYENEFIYKDDLSVTHGKHNLKFGAQYSRTSERQQLRCLQVRLQHRQ